MTSGGRGMLTRLAAMFHYTRVSARQADPNGKGMAPPTVSWPRSARRTTRSMACPNCGSNLPKPLLLTIEFTTSPGSRKKTSVLRCPACTCPFYAAQIPPDYTEEAMLERGRVPFYLQQGAGLSLITRPLAQLRAPPGSTYAEVGCGFGFGLDYAQHAKQWHGHGIDPGGISVLGQNMLGVSIDRRYLGETEPTLSATCDVVMASETVEHVPSPIGFVRVLRSMLRPGGTLILTTPDGADIRPETAPGVLIGLLSPGLHLIFQTRDSLNRILRDAGFAHVLIHKDGHSLVAFASDQPVVLQTDEGVLKTEYRTYLETRSTAFPFDSDLFLAFAGRALQEAVNDGALDQARRVRTHLDEACIARFGHPLDELGAQSADLEGASLEDLVQRAPLSLGGLLYADAILRLASGEARAGLGQRFLHAASAARRLCLALAELALADGMSEEIAWTAQAEAVLCAAAAGSEDILERLAGLPPGPDAEDGARRRSAITQRALVELVNAGHYALAGTLVDETGLAASSWADPDVTAPRSASERDALFSLAVLESQSDEIPVIERSRHRFNCIRRILESSGGQDVPEGLVEAAARGELTAAGRAWNARVQMLLESADAGASDVMEQVMSLPPAPDAEQGEAKRDAIIQRALAGLVNAGHYSLAAEVVDAVGLANKSWADPAATEPRSETERDALFCLAVLDSQSDEPPVIERGRARFSRIIAMLRTPNADGTEGLFEAAKRGEAAAIERLGLRDTGVTTSGTPADRVSG